MTLMTFIKISSCFLLLILLVNATRSDKKESISYENYRKTGGNSYIKLSDGWTNYELTENPDAKHTVVLLHGGTIPLCIWEPQMNALRNAGFRILRYDQYGRGFSDRPDTVYSRDLFARQLKELLDSLKISDPVDLVGPSFGGAITATFAARYSERVNSIIFISPALNVINSNSPLAGPIKIMRKPVIGTFLYKTIIKRKLIERAGSIAPGGKGSPCHSNFTSQFTCKGTDRALLSMFKGDAFGDYRELTRTTGKSVHDILLIHGKADKEITGEMIEQIQEDLPNCQFVELQKSGHSPGTDATDILNGIIVDYISKVQ